MDEEKEEILPGEPCVRYPSQVTYPDGATMCTSVCFMMGCGLVSQYNIQTPPTQEQMRVAMEVASVVHRKLITMVDYQQSLFSLTDVRDAIGIPRDVICTEIMGSVGPLPDGFIASFDDAEDNACVVTDMKTFIQNIPRHSVALVTINSHTTLIYRRATLHWYFDPMVAVFRCFPHRDILFQYVERKIPVHCGEFTGMLLRKRE